MAPVEEDIPEHNNLELLTSILPEHLDGVLPGYEGIYDVQNRVFRVESTSCRDDDSLPPYYIVKGKRKEVRPSTREHLPVSRAKGLETEISMAWNKAAKEAGAASIRILNEVDETPFPLSTTAFVYRECSWEYGAGTWKPEHTSAFLPGCECKDGCKEYKSCECQISDEYEGRQPMYRDGKFLFKNGGYEVIECNKNCACNGGPCHNRVAQLPRKVPIEVFKTERNGWGVRPACLVKKGTVMGLYTGKILFDRRRNDHEILARIDDYDEREADDLDETYSFSLDTRDANNNDDNLRFFVVYSDKTGNWTRFVNHSCNPNTQVYPVMYDTAPQFNNPMLAFVARRDIEACTEITLDYKPNMKKSKRKVTNENRCMCGAQNCRGSL